MQLLVCGGGETDFSVSGVIPLGGAVLGHLMSGAAFEGLPLARPGPLWCILKESVPLQFVLTNPLAFQETCLISVATLFVGVFCTYICPLGDGSSQ